MALKPLAALVVRYPLSFVIAGLVGSALSLLLAMTSLEFQFGRGALISSSDRYQQLAERDELEFENVPERVVVAIRADDPERAKAFAAALAARWAHDPKIESVLHRVDLDRLRDKAFWFLSPGGRLDHKRRFESSSRRSPLCSMTRRSRDPPGRRSEESASPPSFATDSTSSTWLGNRWERSGAV